HKFAYAVTSTSLAAWPPIGQSNLRVRNPQRFGERGSHRVEAVEKGPVSNGAAGRQKKADKEEGGRKIDPA
ncbi:hypothetical protein ABQF26_28040, partial [Mycolicibacterium elephantis]